MSKTEEKSNEIYKLYKLGYSDKKIGDLTGFSSSAIRDFRITHNLPTNFKKETDEEKNKPLTKEQKEILAGTLLGDSSLQFFSKKNKTPAFTCCHSAEQQNYARLIAEKLDGICKERKRFDKRTKKIYHSFDVRTKCKTDYLFFYNNLYFNGVKKITNIYLENFTEKSLAFLYMDDGYCVHDTAVICSDCFDEESCDVFIAFLEKKFLLHFRKNYKKEKNKKTKIRLRLAFNDRIKFCEMIEPFMIESLKYKLPPKKLSKSTVVNYKKNTAQFIEFAKQYYNEKYDFSKVVYINNKTEVCLIEKNTGKEVWRKPVNMTRQIKKKTLKQF